MNAATPPTIQPAVRSLRVGDRDIETDSEGYLRYLGDWCEDFVRAQARAEDLALTDEHWRAMIRHFAQAWGSQRGNNHYLHQIFPRGGPQKQGNRLAGLLRTKGEH